MGRGIQMFSIASACRSVENTAAKPRALSPAGIYFVLIIGVVFAAVLSAASKSSVHSLAVVVHKSSTVDDVSTAALRKMLTGDLRSWTDSTPVILIQQPEENPSQQRMLQLLLRTTPAAYSRQLLQFQFQGKHLPSIRILNSDTNAIAFVWNVPGAASMVEAEAALARSDKVKVIRVDGKLPGEPGYPLQ